jgi:hypothetical protein
MHTYTTQTQMPTRIHMHIQIQIQIQIQISNFKIQNSKFKISELTWRVHHLRRESQEIHTSSSYRASRRNNARRLRRCRSRPSSHHRSFQSYSRSPSRGGAQNGCPRGAPQTRRSPGSVVILGSPIRRRKVQHPVERKLQINTKRKFSPSDPGSSCSWRQLVG